VPCSDTPLQPKRLTSAGTGGILRRMRLIHALGIAGVLCGAGVAGSALLASCAASLNEAPLAEEEAKVVAILHTRDRELTIMGGERGLRYTLVSADGELHDEITIDELAALDAELYEVVKSATAREQVGASRGLRGLDARYVPAPSPPETNAELKRLGR
jgi:hypothetical protein